MTPAASVPTSTYRLQLRREFGFADAAEQVDYLHDLGASHVYLSPILAAAPGSAHGYDIVDHARLSDDAGGRAAFDGLVARLHAHGMGAVADVVPNHMALPTPAYLSGPVWDLLRRGRDSPYEPWFDVDWEAGEDTIVLPVLGEPLPDVLAAGTLVLDRHGGRGGDETVLRYYEHEFPVRSGTEELPLAELLRRQWYRLGWWREADAELNYRRFFDVKSLLAVRVEEPAVFEATHRLPLDLVAGASLAGLRVDHPDGLADPRGYTRMLAKATGGAWVVVEKILQGDERLPGDWPVAGTTGYDTLRRVGGVFVDPRGADPLQAVVGLLTGEAPTAAQVALQAKQQVGLRVQQPEVARLVRLLVTATGDDAPFAAPTLRRVVSALLVGMDRYRAYVNPGEPAAAETVAAVEDAADRARALLGPDEHPALEAVRDLVLGRRGAGEPVGDPAAAARAELVIRFQQTCGPVMAKGVEDTAFYRHVRLTALNEVGGDPDRCGVAPDELHAFANCQLEQWPATMSALSTHDTKRSEDTRARLLPLSELAVEWSVWLSEAMRLVAPRRPGRLDAATEYLLWQTLVGTWPISLERLAAYAEKAVREAALHTSWTDPDIGYEHAVRELVGVLVREPAVAGHVEAWLERTRPHVRAVTLGQKLLQLVLPGVPDVYQGTELVTRTLVDPDNRRPVDFAERRARLAALDAGTPPADLSDEKLLVTSRALRLRREHPDWFGAGSLYQPIAASSPCALAVGRGPRRGVEVVAVVTRLVETLRAGGGFRDHRLVLPGGGWRDLLGQGEPAQAGSVRLADVLRDRPVALLVREG